MKRITLVLGVLFWTMLGSAAVAQDPFQNALENNPINQSSTWVNPDTGTSGSVVPVRTFANAEGNPCREFQSTIVIDGREERGYGTACRQPDGSWRVVSGQTAAAPPVEQRTTVYVREAPSPYYYSSYPYYPYGYYPYSYYPAWGYGYPYWYPFSFSFGYFYHDGGHHHGSKHYGGSYYKGGGRHYGGGSSKWHGAGQRSGGGGHFSGGQRGGSGGGGGQRGGGGGSKWSGGGSRR